MELALARLTTRQEVGVGLGGSAALIGLVYLFWIAPANTAIAAQRQALDTLRNDIARGRTTERRMPAGQRLSDALRVRVAALQAMVLRDSELAGVLRDAQAIAEASELWITGLKPASTVAGDRWIQRSVTLEFDGSFTPLARFLEAMSHYPRLVTVSELRLRAAAHPANGTTLTGSCRLTAFTSREAAAVSGAGRGGSAPLSSARDDAGALGEREAATEALP